MRARLLPNDVRVTVEQSLPGNLSPIDWHLMLEVVEAVKAAIRDASNRPPRAVLEHVLDALGNCPTNGPSANSGDWRPSCHCSGWSLDFLPNVILLAM